LIVTNDSRDIVGQAMAWHLREAGMTAEDWQAFVTWLEADPAHARAYDKLATGARIADAVLPAATAAMPANDNAPWFQRRGFLMGGGAAIAASLAILVAPAIRSPAPAPAEWLIATAPGAPQTVKLADGTLIDVNGGTRLRLDRGNARIASLDAGEATFHVRHDAGAPFTLRSGGMVVQDVGTVFNVARCGNRIDVAVAEGAVLFQPGAGAVMMKAGAALSARDGVRGVALSTIPLDTVGGWKGGRLRFSSEPVLWLAQAIHRRYGTDIVVDRGLAAKPFTGMITMTGDVKRDIPHVAALIGAGWRQDGVRWTLFPIQGEQN
jgi:transmembrane sensor